MHHCLQISLRHRGMDALHHLSAEVKRIVTAPYAASLQVCPKRRIPTPVNQFVCDDSLRRSVQKLLRILDATPQYEIQRWATGRCDISLLCIAVLENLPGSSWAIEVVRRLCRLLITFVQLPTSFCLTLKSSSLHLNFPRCCA